MARTWAEHRVIWEPRIFALMRFGLGGAAFAVAFSHTLEWLAENGIKQHSGIVTAACIDVLALICLHTLAKATDALVRVLAALGFTVSVTLSLCAQYAVGSSGTGAGPWLALMPVATFAFLTIMAEIQNRRERAQVRQPDTGQDSQVDSEVDSAVDTPSAVHLQVSTSPAALEWVRRGDRPELPVVSRTPAKTKVPRPDPRPKPPEEKKIRLATSGGKTVIPDEIRAKIEAKQMTHAQAAADLGVSTKTISRAMRPSKESDAAQASGE